MGVVGVCDDGVEIGDRHRAQVLAEGGRVAGPAGRAVEVERRRRIAAGRQDIFDMQQWRNAAPLSKASAVRVPVPVKTKARSLPASQPGRATISCTMAERSGVRWARPASPTVVQAAGVQAAKASVVAREDTLFAALVKTAASSASWPRMLSEVVAEPTSSVRNWT